MLEINKPWLFKYGLIIAQSGHRCQYQTGTYKGARCKAYVNRKERSKDDMTWHDRPCKKKGHKKCSKNLKTCSVSTKKHEKNKQMDSIFVCCTDCHICRIWLNLPTRVYSAMVALKMAKLPEQIALNKNQP